jgi:hypothetical protein
MPVRATPTPAFLACAALMAFLPGAALAQAVGSPAFEFVATDNAVKAVGRWAQKMERGRTFFLSPTNSAEIHCNRSGMACWESRAELVALQEPKKSQNLTVKNTQFRITEWSQSRLIARGDSADGDLMLRVDLQGRTVQLTYWDAKPDAATGKADGFVWELR